MTFAEEKRFYEQDEKKYEITKNKELLNWLKEKIKNGYCPCVQIEKAQDAIDFMVIWYEMKYPNRELEKQNGTIYYQFQNVASISKYMDLEQCLLRGSETLGRILLVPYRTGGSGVHFVKYKDKEIGKDSAFIFLKKKDKRVKIGDSLYLHIDFNPYTGIIFDKIVEEKETEKSITIEEFFQYYKEKKPDLYDLTELEQCLFNHDCDLEFRNKVLELIALKILYSKNSTPKLAYQRAKLFIEEMNGELEIQLSSDKIDEIMNVEKANKKKELIRRINLIKLFMN